MNHKLEILIVIVIVVLTLFVMYGTMACSPLLPWVASIGGECASKMCPNFMGCTQPSEDINLSGNIREYNNSIDYWFETGKGINLWELQNCERVTCPCAAEGCLLYCVDCKESPVAGGVNVS